MIRLAVALFALQAGFYGFSASLPVALSRAGVPDPQIGLIVGTAPLIQIPAAFFVGVILDRVGGLRVFTFAGLAYLVGCGILLLPGVEPGGPSLPFFVSRIVQGIGLASALPAALSLVPGLVPRTRRGLGLAFVGSAHNLTLVALPAMTLAVLAASSFDGVALTILGFVLFGLVLVWIRPMPFFRSAPGGGDVSEGPPGVAQRRLGFAFRRSWAGLIAILVLYLAHWGFITAYLPQRAEAAGADIGLFFVAFGVAILSLRVPSGWLADRVRSIVLMLAGLASAALAILLLTLPPATPLLVVAGALAGCSGALVNTPLLVELARRSGAADRGSAFALFPAGIAMGLVVGSIGGAPLIGALGFEPTILVAMAGLVGAAAIAIADRQLRIPPSARPPSGAGTSVAPVAQVDA